MRWVIHRGSLAGAPLFYLTKLRHQDQPVPSQADWSRIDEVEEEEVEVVEEVEDTTREETGGVLAIPRGSVTMDISMRDPNHTQSPLSPPPTHR